MLEEHDSPAFEGKVGVVGLAEEVHMLREIRAAIGDDPMLRVDANCVWSVADAGEAMRRFAPYQIRNFEDPVMTFEEMSRIRHNTNSTFSTHWPDLRRAAALGTPDYFVLNLVELGGIRRTIEFVRACDLLGFGVWFHSGETGVASAAYLHVAAAIEALREPSQALFRWMTDDVIAEGPFSPKRGVLRPPSGPGLGVTLDPKGLARCHERYRAQGSFPSSAS
jgi:glucarate dehydratase